MAELNIPIPPKRRSGGAPRKPDSIVGRIRALGLGESLALAGKDCTEASRFIFKARKGREAARYKSRLVEGGVRIWCVALPPGEDLFS